MRDTEGPAYLAWVFAGIVALAFLLALFFVGYLIFVPSGILVVE